MCCLLHYIIALPFPQKICATTTMDRKRLYWRGAEATTHNKAGRISHVCHGSVHGWWRFSQALSLGCVKMRYYSRPCKAKTSLFYQYICHLFQKRPITAPHTSCRICPFSMSDISKHLWKKVITKWSLDKCSCLFVQGMLEYIQPRQFDISTQLQIFLQRNTIVIRLKFDKGLSKTAF